MKSYPSVVVLAVALWLFAGVHSVKECGQNKRLSTSKLICYYSTLEEVDGCYCTHVILPANSDVKGIETVKNRAKGVKIYVSVNEFNQGLINLLKTNKVDGLELNLKKLDSKNDISDFISTVKTKIGSDLDIALSVPARADLVAKYFDFKALSKHADFFILQTAFLGASTNVTFHPSRLSGMWDMQNTDSVVDLVTGLGAPLSKLVVAAPVQAFQFTLQNPEYTAPGSPALELKSITRNELCGLMRRNTNWTLERDEDQAGPYIFSKNQWIAFEDSKSMDIKAKYSRVRGMAGIALKDLAQDGGSECGSTVLEAAYNGLSRQARAPRGAVLHSLEREIVDNSASAKPLESVQLSPYKISRIVDTEGKIHVVRQDSRTEFQCSRQGYFVHPRSCNRFYRCVKFNQLSEDYNVFEFDCPAGLAFDERVEVCVWPGSLPHGTPCSGSSEIAPVPRSRFECPSEPGYYADPENCRWFFACLDHGKSPLSAYEFRCPFGLVFDGDRLVCEWPWLVPRCSSGLGVGLDSEYYYGGIAAKGVTGSLQSSGIILQNYDGLGNLGTVKLGGLSGHIQKPIATVYSNVGSGILGLGYQNNGGYIVGGGLSYKAAQALQNAGLLKVNNGYGYQANGQNGQGVLYATAGQSAGGAAYSYQSGQTGVGGESAQGVLYTTSGQSADGAAYAHQAGLTEVGGGSAQGVLYTTAGQSSTDGAAYSHQAGQFGYDGGSVQVTGGGANAYFAGHYDASGSLQGTADGYQGLNIHSTQGHATDGVVEQNAGLKGAVSFQSFTQHHGGGEQTLTQGGSGGYQGFSGTSTAYANTEGEHGANLQYTQVQNNAGEYETSKQAFQVTGFKTGIDLGEENRGYTNGGSDGIQANLQYDNAGYFAVGQNQFDKENVGFGAKIQANAGGASQSFSQFHGQSESENSVAGQLGTGVSGNINIIGGGYSAVGTLSGVDVSHSGVTNVVSSSPGFVSVTTAPVSKVASVPIVTSVPVPGIKTVTGFATVNGGVVANVPELQYKVKSFKEAGLLSNFSNSFANFVVTSPSTEKNFIQQTYSQEGGYVYNKPSQSFEEGLLNTVTVSTARPFVAVTGQPQVYVSSTAKPQVESVVVYSTPNPTTVVHPNTFQKYDTNGGYKYEKPSVEFEEGLRTVSSPKQAVIVEQQPQVLVSSTPSSVASSYGHTNTPTIISKFTIRKPDVQSVGYYYEKPSVQFKQKTVVEDYTYHQPATVLQYHQQQPLVPLYQQPENLSTYTYQSPVQNQGVSTYTYQNVAQQAAGVDYKQFVPTLVQQPLSGGGGSSYQYLNFGSKQLQGGYAYSKSSVEENKLQLPFQYSTPRPVEGYAYEEPSVTAKPTVAAQPAVVTSYFNIGGSKAESGSVVNQENVEYTYTKPETPSVTPVVAVDAPSKPVVVTRYFNLANSKANAESVGYSYSKPINYEDHSVTYSTSRPLVVQQAEHVAPAVASSYFNFGSSKSNEGSYQINVGTAHANQEANHVVYSTPRPVEVQPVQPAVVSNYFNVAHSEANAENSVQQTGTEYTIKFGEIPHTYSTTAKPAVVSSYFNIASSKANAESTQQQQNIGYTYSQPSIPFAETSPTYSTPQPSIETASPAVVTSYFNVYTGKTNSEADVAQQVIYSTPKPAAGVVTSYHNLPAQPAVVTSYVNIGSSTPKSDLYVQEEGHQSPEASPVLYSTPRPATVSSYSYTASTTSKPAFAGENVGYAYSKPEIKFEEATAPRQPVNYVASTTPNPVLIDEGVTPTPAVVTSYFHQQPSRGYEYPKPAIKFEEEPRQPVNEVPFVQKTAYVTGQYQQNFENYEFPNYEKVKQVVFGERINQHQQVQYQQPQVVLNYIQSTPKPTLLSTIRTMARKKIQPVTPALVTFYDSRYSSTPPVSSTTPLTYVSSTVAPQAHVVSSTTSRPISRFSFSSLDDQYQYNDVVKFTTPEPIRTYLPVTSTVKITSALPQVVKSKVVEDFVAPEVTTLARDYLPVRVRTKAPSVVVVSTPSNEYLPSRVRTKAPAKEYLPVEVTTPSNEYLPETTTPELRRIKVVSTTLTPEISTVSRQYLPARVTTTAAPLEYQQTYTIKPRRPSTVKVVRPVTVIKQNDAHPLLSAKLGAQCTCVSNSLTLRKKQKIIIVEDDDDDNGDDDGYIVDEGNTGRLVENYEPHRVQQEVYVKSTTAQPQVYVKKRVKVRPVAKQSYSPVTEVFYQKNTSPALIGDVDDDSSPSGKEVSKAVRTGLKLVKQAAKQGAREGICRPDRYFKNYIKAETYNEKLFKAIAALIQVHRIRGESLSTSGAAIAPDQSSDKYVEGTEEALSKQFDRYGPGGVRGRSETLQGTIDCQRAGLFRHPTQCNKFYACRWDCTKKRFTLHVFNCPVHLTFDNTLGACNWPSQGPACVENTLITSD